MTCSFNRIIVNSTAGINCYRKREKVIEMFQRHLDAHMSQQYVDLHTCKFAHMGNISVVHSHPILHFTKKSFKRCFEDPLEEF